MLHPGSYCGIFALMVLTGCGLPVPEEVFIIGAGVPVYGWLRRSRPLE